MQIQLKQTEIVEALKQYITKQGFSLVGKSVDVSFTAGRSGTGITADIAIEDSNQLPLLEPDDQEASKPALAVVNGAPVPQDAPEPVPLPEAAPTEAEPRPVSSLFGS